MESSNFNNILDKFTRHDKTISQNPLEFVDSASDLYNIHMP